MEKKILLISPSGAAGLIADLGNGEPTEIGDRTSRYIEIAKGRTRNIEETVKVCLIEDKVDLPEDDQGYRIHLINDIDGTNCRMFFTERLGECELQAMLGEILSNLEKGVL